MPDNRRSPQPSDYDLEAILAEFGDGEKPAPAPQERLADRSKRLVMKTMDDAFSADGFDMLGGLIEETAAREASASPAPRPAPPRPKPEPEPKPMPEPEPEPEPEPALETSELTDDEGTVDYAGAGAGASDAGELDLGAEEPDPETEALKQKAKEKGERFLSPLVGFLALIALRREQRAKGDARRPTAEAPDQPESAPQDAVKLYGSQMRSLLLRGRIAAGLCVIMLYLTYAWGSALPLTGALRANYRAISMVLVIFEISVVMCGLDIFTAGLLAIPQKRMGANTLVSVSCALSILDALILALANKSDWGLPFCTISAISMAFAIWGAYYAYKGGRAGFRVLTASKTAYTVTAESGIVPQELSLLKSRRDTKGFISRSEEEDLGEYIYSTLTPFLLLAALVLGLLSSLVRGRPGAVLHCISILSAVSASFSGAICFAVPFAVTARKLAQSGAAIAGWSGLRDIGKSRHVVVTDGDLFPRGNVQIGKIGFESGSDAEKVISYAGSVVVASGNDLAGAFADLLRRNGFSLCKVDAFTPQDGGGMAAVVNGERVLVGSSSFMNLLGLSLRGKRVPQWLSERNVLYAAIGGRIVGCFEVLYQPSSSVQEALVLLLTRSKLEPIFAIRDFNITPSMIKARFKLPTDDFRFPSFAERYRISAAEPDRYSRVAAVLVREGLGPLADAADRGKRTYLGICIAAAVAAACSVIGLLTLFFMCWSGAFDSASAANVASFMLVLLIPMAVIVLGLEK